MTSPRPLRPSTVTLPATPPAGVVTLLDFFRWRFPRVAAEEWAGRFDGGRVWTSRGPASADDPFQPGAAVHYRREVQAEPPVRTDFRLAWRDQHLLVVDKPPFLPTTPGGSYARHCLLHLLEEHLGEPGLAPLHRLDRLTSGLVVLSREPASRGHFARLFQSGDRRLEKHYLAVCDLLGPPPPERATLLDHVARSAADYCRQEVVTGLPANARLDLAVRARQGDLALLELRPATGRKHQIRVQLAHAGWPVAGDPLYGPERRHDPADLDRRLWLDAWRLVVRGYPGFSGSPPLEADWRSSCQPEAMLAAAAAGRSAGPRRASRE